MKALYAMFVVFLMSSSLGLMSPVSSEAATEEDLGTIRSEIEALKEGQKVIRDDLKAIKDLLTARQKARNPVQDVDLTIQVANDPAKGKRTHG